MNRAASATVPSRRSPIRGLVQIVRFNWPQYVVGSSAIVLAAALVAVVPLPSVVRWIIVAGVAAAAWWLVASLVVSYWIYDLSPLTLWNWLVQYLPSVPVTPHVLNIHSGFDDTTARLQELLPRATVVTVDLFDPRRMTEPSIHRARRAMPPLVGTIGAAPEKLPLDSDLADAVLLLLAAHELREPAEREALFGELRRVLKPGGRLVLAEHARDAWNFLAFGPGFLHFLRYAEWLRLGRGADLRIVRAGRVTPFVRFLVLEK